MNDKNKVLAGGPWTFDRALIVLKSPTVNENLENLEFTSADLWIQIHNVPFKCLTRKMALVLGKEVGIVIDIDCDEDEGWSGPFLKVRVTIDITQPFMRGLKVCNSDSDLVWCPILYEKLPDFCFNCGLIGHSHRDVKVTL